jgi:hypothetical protein
MAHSTSTWTSYARYTIASGSIRFIKLFAIIIILTWTKHLSQRVTGSTACSCTCCTTKFSTADTSSDGTSTRKGQRATSAAKQAAPQITKPPTKEAATSRTSSDTTLVRLQAKRIVNANWVVSVAGLF